MDSTYRYIRSRKLYRNDSRIVPLAAACVALFVFSFFLRWQYLAGAEEAIDIRADSVKYFTAAYNNFKFGAHSLDPPNGTRAPSTRTDLAPGYPIFLSLFFSDPPDSRKIKPRVQLAQAILGSLTCVSALLLAYAFVPLGWAFFAAFLVAISPHHIALSEVILTETLYTSMLMTGLATSIYGWRRSSMTMSFLGMLILCFSGHVRTIGFVVPLALAPILLLTPGGIEPRGMKTRISIGGAACVGALVVYVTFQWFAATAMDVAGKNDALQRDYTNLKTPLEYLSNSAKPPNFYVAGLTHVIVDNKDPDSRFRTDRGFSEIPEKYLSWNCCARWLYAWHFDNAYNGGVEIYPMRASTFDSSELLGSLRTLMRWLHWPLYALAIFSGVFAIIAFLQRKKCGLYAHIFPIAVVWFSFIAGLSIVHWLPRYAIPVYPISYILATTSLYTITKYMKQARGSVTMS